jgi:hypothetical protein
MAIWLVITTAGNPDHFFALKQKKIHFWTDNINLALCYTLCALYNIVAVPICGSVKETESQNKKIYNNK